MLSYRCFLKNVRGVVIATEDFDSRSEADALSTAQRLSEARQAAGFELWQRPRLLVAEPPDHPKAAMG